MEKEVEPRKFKKREFPSTNLKVAEGVLCQEKLPLQNDGVWLKEAGH